MMMPHKAITKDCIKIVIAFLLVLICPRISFGAELYDLKVCGHDAKNLDYIEVYEADLVEVEKKVWQKKSTFCVAVEGTIFPAADVSKVYYSLNGGMLFWRAQGDDPFNFTFVPYEGTTYSVVLRFYNKYNDLLFQHSFQIKYTTIDWQAFFQDKLETIRRAYEAEDLEQIMSLINERDFPSMDEFKANLGRTFNENSRIRLSLTMKSVEMATDGYTVTLDWHKTFEDDSSQSGEDSVINFRQDYYDQVWRIASLSDESIFLVGSGTLDVNY